MKDTLPKDVLTNDEDFRGSGIVCCNSAHGIPTKEYTA